jgi:hypothetical protein
MRILIKELAQIIKNYILLFQHPTQSQKLIKLAQNHQVTIPTQWVE